MFYELMLVCYYTGRLVTHATRDHLEEELRRLVLRCR